MATSHAIDGDLTASVTTGDARPVLSGERIASLDIIRGVAVLGILILNIVIMGLPFAVFQNPAAFEPPTTSTFISWYVAMFAFEGTFRTIFGILFGAGVYIFMSRVEERFDARRARTLHLKRMVWLIALGLFDAYVLLWFGDILYAYGVVGLILWLFRRASNRTLWIWIAVFTLVSVLLKTGQAYELEVGIDQLAAYDARIAAGETLSEDDAASHAEIAEGLAFTFPSESDVERGVAQVRSGYVGAWTHFAPLIVLFQTLFMAVFAIWDSLITMLLGIILFRSGFLQNNFSSRTYLITALIGYGFAVPVRLLILNSFVEDGFDMTTFMWGNTVYDFVRIGMAMGHISVVLMLVQASALPLAANLAATGRMALTNYLMQSLIALIVFILMGYYGTFDRAELYLIVAAIWAFQLWFSPRYLSRHAQGPMEALWRRLTYGPATQST